MKGYFDTFPYIEYGDTKIKDIFRRVRPTEDLDDVFQLYEYIVQDGETPELLAHKKYDDPQRHWIILMINDVIDPYFGWVLSSVELERYTDKKYHDINGFHHYEDEDGGIVYDDRALDPNAYNLIYVTNIQHETALNEAKRSIKMMPFEYISEFEKMFEGKI
jgi:hypothetical protein